MIVDEGDRLFRPLLHQRIVKDRLHAVVVIAARSMIEIIVQGNVEQRHLVIDHVEIVFQAVQFTAPVLSDSRERFPGISAQPCKQLLIELKADVLYGIQPQAVHAGHTHIPEEPFRSFPDDFRIVHVHVHAHQVVKIAELRINVRLPVLAREAEDHIRCLRILIPVRAREMRMIPGKAAVFSGSSRKCELRPDLYLLFSADLLIPVLRRIRDRRDFLRLVAAHPVVQDDVREHLYPGSLQRPDRFQVFFLRSVFGTHCALLVKLSQIIHIINAVADIILAGSLIGRRQPDLRDPEIMQAFRLGRTALPPEAVIRQIPFKILHHCFIRHLSSPVFHRDGRSVPSGIISFVIYVFIIQLPQNLFVTILCRIC